MPQEFPLTCHVPEAWLIALDHYASTHSQSRSDVLKEAIAQYLDIEAPPPWQPQLDTLNTTVTTLTKQVHSLHKRLKTLEAQTLDIASVTAEIVTPLPAPRDRLSLPAAPERDRPDSRPFGSIRLDELSQLVPLNMPKIRHHAETAGLSLYEAIEIETGWKYDPRSHTFAPPL